MEAFATPSTSPSHYSKEVIGLLIGTGIFALMICIAWGYIYYKGGPKEMLRVRRERRKAKREARDIEMALAEDRADRAAVQEYKQRVARNKKQEEEKEAHEAAQETIEAVTMANGLVGSVVTPPQRVDLKEDWNKEFDEELSAQRMKQLHVQQGKTLEKDWVALSDVPAIDPMSLTMGRGQDMAALYR